MATRKYRWWTIQQKNKISFSIKIHQDKSTLTTRIKFRNFLSNIANVRINKEGFYNENFIFDFYLLVTQNLNSFSLDRKLTEKDKHGMIYMIWKEHMPQKFQGHICKKKNFLYLNGNNVVQPKVLEIITDFLNEQEENYKDLQNNLSSYINIFQYVYCNVFPETYCSNERRGFDLRSYSHIIFKSHKDKKLLEISLERNPGNYKTIRNQRPLLLNRRKEDKEK